MLYTIGEILIDFIANQKASKLKDVESFKKVAGGAPANVAACVATFGEQSTMITQVGDDAFGEFLIENLLSCGVNTNLIKKSQEANTGLAFVSVQDDGERDFSFFRNPSADMLLEASDIESMWFDEGDYLHFCSVSLVESPMKEAHRQAITFAREKGSVISFDPNVRLTLWSDASECRSVIQEFMPFADIIKVSDEELEFITGEADEMLALDSLFVGNVKVIIYTKGEKGAMVMTRNQMYNHSGFKVKVEDTTGAGDAFIGSFLYQLSHHHIKRHELIAFIDTKHKMLLQFSNAGAALTTTRRGAIGALPSLSEVETFISIR